MGGKINPTSHQGNVSTVNKTGKNLQPATGNSTLVAGAVTINTPHINSKSIVLFGKNGLNASTAIGDLAATDIVPGENFKVVSLDSTGSVEIGDISTFYWMIIGG